MPIEYGLDAVLARAAAQSMYPLIRRQLLYIVVSLLHPKRLYQGYAMCPECMGQGTTNGSVCCLCVNEIRKAPSGFLRVSVALDRWDFIRWERKAPYLVFRYIPQGNRLLPIL